MLVTIRVPNNAVKLQYAVPLDGYETWETIGFGDIVAVSSEDE